MNRTVYFQPPGIRPQYCEEKEEQFEYWSKNVCDKSLDVKKRKSTFDRELGIKTLKSQLKTINFILQ